MLIMIQILDIQGNYIYIYLYIYICVRICGAWGSVVVRALRY